MRKDNMVAMILAGGRGSRLYDLTKKVAKPAVHFGGKYRIIDFPLSNCANSGVSVVGVLTQYENVLLNSYVARDQHWGLDSKDGGVFVLSPREKDGAGFGLYQGTADAITQNIDFLDQMEAEYVLILSGDHIYKMDYDLMLEEHKKNQADCTIAVLQVTLKEATRFGIMNTNENDEIIEFEEKPKNPKSNLASMGIYIFSYKTFKKILISDDKNPESSHDFGNDIIPALLAENKKIMAYRFKGYWKDVGTVDSLWESNLDLLKPNNRLDLGDTSWKIYTEDNDSLPHIIGDYGSVNNAYVNQGSIINGYVENSVIFSGVVIEKGARVVDSVIMPGVTVKENASITRCIVQEDVTILANKVHGDGDNAPIKLVTKKNSKEV